MIGEKGPLDQTVHTFVMADLIPEGHILKLIDRHVDFSFIRERVRHLYSHTGRPSVRPETLVRMLLIGYLFGIRSERRLCEEVSMHVGYRWFALLGMEDKVPDHSVFSKYRHGRFADGGLWEELFDETVRRCIEAGLVRGEHVTADGTLVEADASLSSMEPIEVAQTPGEYLKLLAAGSGPEAKKEDDESGGDFHNRGGRIGNATHTSRTDPDSRLARKHDKAPTKLSYLVGLIMDNASRVILDAAATADCTRRGEAALALDGLGRMRWRYGLRPATIGADKGYAVGGFIREAYEMGVTPHVPVWDTRAEHDRGIWGIEKFVYYPDADVFLCPAGKELKCHGIAHDQRRYQAREVDCRGCRRKKQCTRGKLRTLSLHVDADYIEMAREEKETRGYKLSQRNRKKVEELFGEAKEFMCMRRMKFRRLKFIREQVLLTAAAQNLKRLVKHLARLAPRPAEAAKMPLPERENRLAGVVLSLIFMILSVTAAALSDYRNYIFAYQRTT